MLKFEHLTASYGAGPVLEDIGFALAPYEITALVGKNGCGKSTLVGCINQRNPYEGVISFRGMDLSRMGARERAKAVAILPQVLALPHIPVEDLVMFGRNPYLGFGRRPSREDREAVLTAMEDMGVLDMKDRLVDTLSGGERQRAYLAMILAQQTEVVVLDEPTTYMDMETEASFFEAMLRLKTVHRKTLLVILHDLSQAVRWADRMVVLDGARAAFEGTVAACLERGILEETFRVKKHVFQENGEKLVLFTPKTDR